MAENTKLIALRNFSGPKNMILRGDIIEVSEPYVTDWTVSGLCAYYTERQMPKVEPDPHTFKNMKTKKK